jgi:hypothetical protein
LQRRALCNPSSRKTHDFWKTASVFSGGGAPCKIISSKSRLPIRVCRICPPTNDPNKRPTIHHWIHLAALLPCSERPLWPEAINEHLQWVFGLPRLSQACILTRQKASGLLGPWTSQQKTCHPGSSFSLYHNDKDRVCRAATPSHIDLAIHATGKATKGMACMRFAVSCESIGRRNAYNRIGYWWQTSSSVECIPIFHTWTWYRNEIDDKTWEEIQYLLYLEQKAVRIVYARIWLPKVVRV